MLWDMHLCVFDVRLSFENRVYIVYILIPEQLLNSFVLPFK